MKPVVFFRKFHKWLGLLIGLQIFLWLLGGLVMSFFDIDQVRGSHNKAKAEPMKIEGKLGYNSQQLLSDYSLKVEKLELKLWQGVPVWHLEGEDKLLIVDAHTGTQLSPFDEETAKQVAEMDFIGQGKIVKQQLFSENIHDVRGRELPLWQFQFDDADNTRVYVSPKTGEVVARRNDTWRLFDFFWMLHIMDYSERENFNHPLLIIAALLGVMMGLSGLFLTIKLIFFGTRRVKA